MTGVSSCSLCRKSTDGPLILLTFSCRWFSFTPPDTHYNEIIKDLLQGAWSRTELVGERAERESFWKVGKWPLCIKVGCICFFDGLYSYMHLQSQITNIFFIFPTVPCVIISHRKDWQTTDRRASLVYFFFSTVNFFFHKISSALNFTFIRRKKTHSTESCTFKQNQDERKEKKSLSQLVLFNTQCICGGKTLNEFYQSAIHVTQLFSLPRTKVQFNWLNIFS